MPNYLPYSVPKNSRFMVFVDGENIAIRYKEHLKSKNVHPEPHVSHLENIYVWTNYLNMHHHVNCSLIRSYYYTCANADENRIIEIQDELICCGITDPRVFKKKNKIRSKRVDITLATEMLSHSYNDNFEVAVLVAGDEDYVPLVQEVKRAGKQVALWFLKDGLSNHLKRECDIFLDLSYYLFNTAENLNRRL